MIILFVLALWAINAPCGYVVGSLAAQHMSDADPNEVRIAMPWLCALLPPMAGMLAIYLLIFEQMRKEN